MQNKKFDSQVKNVPIFKDPRRRKAMWEEHVSGNTLVNTVKVLEYISQSM